MKRPLIMKLPPDNPDGLSHMWYVRNVPVWETAEVNYSVKFVAISRLRVRVLEEKVIG